MNFLSLLSLFIFPCASFSKGSNLKRKSCDQPTIFKPEAQIATDSNKRSNMVIIHLSVKQLVWYVKINISTIKLECLVEGFFIILQLFFFVAQPPRANKCERTEPKTSSPVSIPYLLTFFFLWHTFVKMQLHYHIHIHPDLYSLLKPLFMCLCVCCTTPWCNFFFILCDHHNIHLLYSY